MFSLAPKDSVSPISGSFRQTHGHGCNQGSGLLEQGGFLRFAAKVFPRGTFFGHGQQAVGSNPPSEHAPVTLPPDVPPACCNPAAFFLVPHFQASVAQIETLRTIRTSLVSIIYKCVVAVCFVHSCRRACNTLSPQYPLPLYPTREKLKHARCKGLAMATRVPSCAQLQRRAATQERCFVGCRVVCSVRRESDEFRSSPSFCRPVTIGTKDHIVKTPGVLIDAECFPFHRVCWVSTKVTL